MKPERPPLCPEIGRNQSGKRGRGGLKWLDLGKLIVKFLLLLLEST